MRDSSSNAAAPQTSKTAKALSQTAEYDNGGCSEGFAFHCRIDAAGGLAAGYFALSIGFSEGGILTSTILTLVVLPALCRMAFKEEEKTV
jgi:hypothetical protein